MNLHSTSIFITSKILHPLITGTTIAPIITTTLHPMATATDPNSRPMIHGLYKMDLISGMSVSTTRMVPTSVLQGLILTATIMEITITKMVVLRMIAITKVETETSIQSHPMILTPMMMIRMWSQ
jgi:hypothetical protein